MTHPYGDVPSLPPALVKAAILMGAQAPPPGYCQHPHYIILSTKTWCVGCLHAVHDVVATFNTTLLLPPAVQDVVATSSSFLCAVFMSISGRHRFLASSSLWDGGTSHAALLTSIHFNKVLYYSRVLHCTVSHFILLHSLALFRAVMNCTVMYCIAQYFTLLYCTVLHCTVLYCTALY